MTAHNPRPIFLVDDDRAVRRSTKWLLEADGYKVVTAANGTEALRKLRKGLRPCLILLDLTMSDMDGFEFRRQQLNDAKLSAIPVAVYSGGPADARAQSLGVTYLKKPFDVDALLGIVEKHCRAA